jgi:hypothetical protein
VAKILVAPYVVDNRKKEFLIDEATFREFKSNPSYALEARCIRLEDKSHEQCWPHNGELILNQFKYLEFKPLQQNSSLKKRKDEKFVSTEINCGTNAFWLKFVRNSDPRNPRAEETYVAAVFLVKRLTCDELVKKIRLENRRPVEECKRRIQDDFTSSGVDIDKLVYPLTCVFDMQPLKTPAKGTHCKHSNCFSLENYVNVWQKNNQRKWNCPICKLKSYDIIVDCYYEQIIDEVKRSGESLAQVEVQILKNAEYKLSKIEDDTDSEDEQKVDVKTEKPSDKQQLNLIVLDDSDDEGSKAGPAKTSEPSTKMVIETNGEKKKAPETIMLEEKKDAKGVDPKTKFSPIPISSNDATPVKQREYSETEPRNIKTVPIPSDKEQQKLLDAKHKEALKNKGISPMMKMPHPHPMANILESQLQQQAAYQAYMQNAQQKQQQQQQQLQQNAQQKQQQQVPQDKIQQPQQPQPQTQASPNQANQANQANKFPTNPADIFAYMQKQQQQQQQQQKNFFNPYLHANPALINQFLQFGGNAPPGLKVPKINFPQMNPNDHARLLQEYMYPKLGGMNTDLSGLMRKFDMGNGGLLRPGQSPMMPQSSPTLDSNLNFLSGTRTPQQGTNLNDAAGIGSQGGQKVLTGRIEGENNLGASPNTAGGQKGLPQDNKVQKNFFETTQRDIDKLVDCTELRLELPSFEGFKSQNKNYETKNVNENDFKTDKNFLLQIQKQLQHAQNQGFKEKKQNTEMIIESSNLNANGHMEVESRSSLGKTPTKVGNVADPICLD